jgi:uncharacterized membrane protein SpoIIM required for sporulation
VAEFFTREFPRCFRRNFLFILAAFLVSVAGALVGLFATLSNREAIDLLMGPGWSRELEELGKRHRVHHDWMPSEERPFFSTFLPTHNIQVAFMVFAGGIFAGLLTLYLLVENGVMLGAAAVAVARYHTSLEFWGFVAPHGVVELPSIFIAGGAGLMLAYALVNPGEYSRRTALAMAGRDAVVLILGVVAMLVIAGLTEAFFSPALISPYLKFLVAAVNLTAETAYFVAAGRSEQGVGCWVWSVGKDLSQSQHPTSNTQDLASAIRPLPPL